MAVKEEYVNYIVDELSEFGEIKAKKMFGTIGFFREGLMFGIISKDLFRLKVDDTNKPEYVAAGAQLLMSKTKKRGMPYSSVPVEVLEDKDTLAKWAQTSFEISVKNKKKSKK
ncbi:MAG: DNA transformation protein [Patiriisocius sp.]|jgi:DNA transformation protein